MRRQQPHDEHEEEDEEPHITRRGPSSVVQRQRHPHSHHPHHAPHLQLPCWASDSSSSSSSDESGSSAGGNLDLLLCAVAQVSHSRTTWEAMSQRVSHCTS
jgi:hypothetical protein